MKVKNRLNNFESIPGSKILPGGCSCCCCCCCLHGLGIGSAGATWGWKLGKTGWTKTFLAIGLFLLAGGLGLALDAGVLLFLFEVVRIRPDELNFVIYGLSFLIFTFLSYKLVFHFTKKNTLVEITGKDHNLSLAERKIAYHKSRLIFQVILFVPSIVLGIFTGYLLSPLFYIISDSPYSMYLYSFGISLLSTLVLYIIGQFFDKYLRNVVIGGYFFLSYFVVSALLSQFAMHVIRFSLSPFFSFFISAFIFEYLRFTYIKSHPEIFRK